MGSKPYANYANLQHWICCCQTARVCILVVHIFPYNSFKHCTKWIEDFRNMDIFLKKSDFSTKTSEGFMILQWIKNSHNKNHHITFYFTLWFAWLISVVLAKLQWGNKSDNKNGIVPSGILLLANQPHLVVQSVL